ncbi:SIMPL domain-containing protein [Occallatibacter savannae]|uniref:SIMPL domain-containing protein n=1 Tax=Occallatibacter savannae TaxID=1002691 RepID=UPI0013A58EA7|nr:SIMPL domain-containing protein [Occallatibacter savannae]
MKLPFAALTSAVLGAALSAGAQQQTQPELKVDSSNRTLTVSATDNVSVEPDQAILHIGFVTQPQDAKGAYAEGTRASNAIISALKQAGVAESAIRSESQYLDRDWTTKLRKYTLHQDWTVKVAPERAAEILDAAVNAGATSSGQIEWTVKDEKALEAQALDKAAARARANAEVLAKGMGVRLGALIYVSNQMSAPSFPRPMPMKAMKAANAAPEPLAIEPHQVSREATVYAVFAIE